MKGNLRILILALLFGLLTNQPSRAQDAGPPKNPFTGSWSGSYSLPDLGGGGTVEFTISKTGVLNGMSVNFDGTAHTLIGHIESNGSAVGVAIFQDSGHATEFWSGACWIAADGQMLGDLTGCIQNNCFTLLIAVVQKWGLPA